MVLTVAAEEEEEEPLDAGAEEGAHTPFSSSLRMSCAASAWSWRARKAALAEPWKKITMLAWARAECTRANTSHAWERPMRAALLEVPSSAPAPAAPAPAPEAEAGAEAEAGG
jgi:hypothetical protein